MRVAIGSDHAGYDLKCELATCIEDLGHEVVDMGTHSSDPVDYPDFAEAVSKEVIEGRAERGVLICGSGVGASIAANKVPGIRAGICHDTYSAHQGVEHDDMNILVVGARIIGVALAREITTTFLAAEFSKEERHRRRLDKVIDIERRYIKGA
jgi:ribose 5-phosphate isomerase B